MRDFIIKANNISKAFKIYEKPSHLLKEILFNRKKHKLLWALKNINFKISQGEVWGIIGDNGSGKSTLLKIIAGVIPPTSGTIEKRGKISALLELGTGFHPEFTGRQNIYFNGVLMGIPTSELRKKEDEIISFSELGDAIDRPIKTYSSGMVVRLAFSIATLVNPDILIIDEALSVGDHYFQKKSFSKMMDFKKRGKTILFCSHSMYHVTHLCDKAIWLNKGKIHKVGLAKEIVLAYENYCREKSKSKEEPSLPYPDSIEILLNKESYKTEDFFEATIYFEGSSPPYHIVFGLKRNDGLTIYASSTHTEGLKPLNVRSGEIKIIIERLPLLPGQYFFDAGLVDVTGNVLMGANKINFEVKGDDKFLGLVKVDHKWLFNI